MSVISDAAVIHITGEHLALLKKQLNNLLIDAKLPVKAFKIFISN